MSNRSNATGSNSSFVGLLTLLFIGLKLCHVINWPWLWVLSPLWISFLLFIVLLTIALILMFFVDKRN